MTKVIMPKKLTAENGAKGLLMGEFSIQFPEYCDQCHGRGCRSCGGEGDRMRKIDVPWVTIKEIYAEAVKHFSQPTQAPQPGDTLKIGDKMAEEHKDWCIGGEAGPCNCKTQEGTKHDTGKLRWDLLPLDALEEVVKIYTFGAQKYDDENWRQGIGWKRIIAAVFRHFTAFVTGDELDKETGLPHLAHATWGLLTLLWYSQHRREFDDRYIVSREAGLKEAAEATEKMLWIDHLNLATLNEERGTK